MDIDRINAHLYQATAASAGKLHWFESLGSTNDYILNALDDCHASVCLAAEQTDGRGRRGRSWTSARGQGIYLSMGWDLEGASPTGLSLVCGLSLLHALLAHGVREAALKWPNDILLAQKKLAGILVELNHGRCAIGIGLNVTIPVLPAIDTGAAAPWTGLVAHGYEPDLELLIATLIVNLNHDLTRFCMEGFSPFIRPWNAHHAFQHAEVTLVGDRLVHGRVIGVSAEGALCLDTEQGKQVFHAGEVSLPLPGSDQHGPECG